MRLSIMAIVLAGTFGLSSCGEAGRTADQQVDLTDSGQQVIASKKVSLVDVAAGDHRTDEARARDQFRNPVATLDFFGLEPNMTVVEIWPGGGWYTDIIAPYLASANGVYYAAGFDPNGASERGLARIAAYSENFVQQPEIFGEIRVTAFSAQAGAVAPAGSADMVLTFRNVHNWMSGGFTNKAFSDFYAALKPGGILGIVEHRLPTTREPDENARTGYVREDAVIAMATSAGFEFVEASDVNANPADTADHPFGVWTLQPVARTSAFGEDPDPSFDRAPYDAIGESDRMTLKFRKPIAADGAFLE